jgi:chemotaxis protein CheY-P-specific phosphatase CheC
MELSPTQLTALRGRIEAGLARATHALGDSLPRKLALSNDQLIAGPPESLPRASADPSDPLAGVCLAFSGPIAGIASLAMSERTAIGWVDALAGGTGTVGDAFWLSGLGEVATVVLSGVLSALGDARGGRLDYGPPQSFDSRRRSWRERATPDPCPVAIHARLLAELEGERFHSELLIAFEVGTWPGLVALLDQGRGTR